MMRVLENTVECCTLHVLTALCVYWLWMTSLQLAVPFVLLSRKSAKAAALDSQLLLLYISHDTCVMYLLLSVLEEKFHSYTIYSTRMISTFLLIKFKLQKPEAREKGVLFWNSDFLNFLGFGKSSWKTSFLIFHHFHFEFNPFSFNQLT